MEKTLLVADDNEQFTKLICEVAQRGDWKCHTFTNGRQLTEALSTLRLPALLLLDLLMPELDGIETIAEIRKTHFQKLRVRFMTGGDPRNASAATLIASSLAFHVGPTLYKPVPMKYLEAMLQEEEGYLRNLGQPPTSETKG
jgi:CheY-like chemotaxis protein